MRTLADEWRDVGACMLPKQAPTAQRTAIKRAFYAGAYSTLRLSAELLEKEARAEAGAAHLERLYKELGAFFLRASGR